MTKEQDQYLFNLFIKAFHDWKYTIEECYDLCEMVKDGKTEEEAKAQIEDNRAYEEYSKRLNLTYFKQKGN